MFLFVLQRGSGEVCCWGTAAASEQPVCSKCSFYAMQGMHRELQLILINGRKSATCFIALFTWPSERFCLLWCTAAHWHYHSAIVSSAASLRSSSSSFSSSSATPQLPALHPQPPFQHKCCVPHNSPLILLLLWLSLLATFSSCS